MTQYNNSWNEILKFNLQKEIIIITAETLYAFIAGSHILVIIQICLYYSHCFNQIFFPS